MALSYPFTPALAGEYARLWDGATILKAVKAQGADAATRILSNRSRYEAVERATGVPWEFVAILHDREASGSFTGVLHNGEKILGTGRKTRKVPKGRGPFATWLEAAIDALRIKGLDKLAEWSVERCLYECERFNGFGYRYRRLPSAYLWAGTSVYQGGKFVADSKFDPSVWDEQLGVVVTMRALMIADPQISFTRGGADRGAVGMAALPTYGPGTWNDQGLKAVQDLLRTKGYASVGTPDGDWGDNTENALEDFQRQNGLRVTGRYDAATAAALPTAGPRPVSSERQSTTSADLRAAGSPTVIGAFRAKVAAMAVGGLGLVQGAIGQIDTASGYLASFRTLFGDVPPLVWGLVVFAVAAVIFISARRAERSAVDAVRTGVDAGPVKLAEVRKLSRTPETAAYDIEAVDHEEEVVTPPTAIVPARRRVRAPSRKAA